jgi:hypothetical protein
MNCIVTLFGEWIYCRNVGGEFQHIHNRVIYITYICRILVNKRLTQYGKARELKPFDEFVLFPLFLSSSCAFSLVLREVIEVVGELFHFFFFYLFFCCFFFFFFFFCVVPSCPTFSSGLSEAYFSPKVLKKLTKRVIDFDKDLKEIL